MKKYYFGLIVLLMLTLGLTSYVLAAGKDGKKDEETNKKLDSINTKLNDHLYSENMIPASLEEVGVKDVPSTITYQKLDDERFKICVHFDSESSAFDAGPLALLTGLVFRAPTPEPSSDEELTYFDGYSLMFNHKKGENCQTVKPTMPGDFNDLNAQDDLNLQDDQAPSNNDLEIQSSEL